MVGREQELQELRRSFELAKEGKGKTVFISAEAGIGKTRLVKEFLESAKKEKNILTLFGWCLFNAGVPYFPFIEAFSNYYSALTKKTENEELELSSWLKGTTNAGASGKFEYVSPSALKDQTFAAVNKTLHSIASQNLIILVIEDIHWADSASLALIHYIARVIKESEKILLLATFRSENLINNYEGYPSPLVETLGVMRREDLLTELKLSSLNPACVTKMAESIMGGKLCKDLTEKLVSESGGNPLFVVESLGMLHEQGRLVKENNEWCLTVNELGIPSVFKDIMIQRLACLNNSQRRILDAASVIGEEFDAGLLSAVLKRESLDVLETLKVIANSTRLVVDQENSFRFDHTKSREIIYEELSKPLKREYHEIIGEKLENADKLPLPLSKITYHFTQSGNQKKALKYSLAAGQDELAHYSNSEALKHFNYFINSAGDKPEYTKAKESALEGLGDALHAQCMFKEAIQTFELLGNIASDTVRLRAFRKAMESAFQLGDTYSLTELIKKAEKHIAADRLEKARVLMSKGRIFTMQNKAAAALENFEAALRVFEEEYSLWDTAWALIGVGIRHPGLGKPREGIDEGLRSVALFEELGDFRWQMEACYVAGHTFNLCLLENEALDMFTKVLKINDQMKMSNYLHMVFAYAFSSKSFVQLGKFDEALRCGQKALELANKTDSVVAQGVAYSTLTRICTRLGDLKNAKNYFEKLLALPPEILVHPYVRGALTKAVFYAGNNQWEESDQYFNECFETFKRLWSTAYGNIVETRLFYAWALEKQRRFDEAKIQVEENVKTREELRKEFELTNIRANLTVRRQVVEGEEFEVRLDLVNVAASSGILLKVEGLIPTGCKVVSEPSFFHVENNLIDLNSKNLDSFQIETIKLRLMFKDARVLKFEPNVFYIDNQGEARKTKTEPITVIALVSSSKEKSENCVPNALRQFEFDFEAAQKAFNFLVRAFKEDNVNRKLAPEKSGWRTLMEVARNAHVTMYSMYGRTGRGGRATMELGRRGVVESRFFLGERGRGGRILKIRIAYEKEKIKQLVGQR